jgi:hypothetical protein
MLMISLKFTAQLQQKWQTDSQTKFSHGSHIMIFTLYKKIV